jgi:serine/threonine protein kinase
MLVGYPPFSDEETSISLERQIIEGIYNFAPQYWSSISNQATDLIRRLLCVDPNKRATLEEVLNHEWLTGDQEIIRKAHELMFSSNSNAVTTSSYFVNQNTNEKRQLDQDQEEATRTSSQEPRPKSHRLKRLRK